MSAKSFSNGPPSWATGHLSSYKPVNRSRRFPGATFAVLVGQVLLGLCAVGIAPGETVAIIGENSLPWLAADLATLAGGFPNVVVAPSLSDGMFVKVLGHAQCRAAFVQNAAVAGRLVNLQGQLPALQQLIVMDDSGAGIVNALNFRQLLERGAGADGLAARLQAVQGNDLATIMYTSGSTGEPKGVMRSQDNLLANITNGGCDTVSAPDELTVNILSLNHLFGRFGFLKSAVTGRTTALIEAAETKVDLPVIEQLSPPDWRWCRGSWSGFGIVYWLKTAIRKAGEISNVSMTRGRAPV